MGEGVPSLCGFFTGAPRRLYLSRFLHERSFNSNTFPPRLLELSRAHPGHPLLLHLRQASPASEADRLLRALRDAAQTVDRDGQPGQEIPGAKLEAASR